MGVRNKQCKYIMTCPKCLWDMTVRPPKARGVSKKANKSPKDITE